ncbi:hypothetical protein D3C73_1593870 [compost metagenome]
MPLKLFKQRRPDATDAYDKNFDHLIGIEQHLMRHAHAGGGIIIVHHHRNRALRRALGDSHDIDVGARQRGKEFRGDTAQRTHTVANY